jgi:CheY-like chemotaxis protein
MPSPGELVLVVESNSAARTQVVQALQKSGYQTLEAATLAQARPMARAPIVAVVLGEQLATREAKQAFSVPIVVMGGELDAKAVVAPVRSAARAAPAEPAWSPPPVSTPAFPSDAATRLAPSATPEELELIAALRDELTFLRQASFYRVLDLDSDASALEIAEAFNHFSNRWHPDCLSADASQEMRAIAGEIYLCGKSAYDVLSDSKKRDAYRSRPPLTQPKEVETRAVKRQSLLQRIIGKE